MQLRPLPPSCSRVVYGLARVNILRIHDKSKLPISARSVHVLCIAFQDSRIPRQGICRSNGSERSLKSIGLFSIENLSSNLLGLFFAKLEALMKTWNSRWSDVLNSALHSFNLLDKCID